MLSPTPLTRFQNESTARTVTVNRAPALWPEGAPVLPSAVPPCAVWPGSRICSPENGPGCTTKLLLVPVRGGGAKSEHVTLTAPPAPRNVTAPVQLLPANVISSG